MWRGHHETVPVGIIDVGSNTVRLDVSRGGKSLYRERVMLRLGDSIERLGLIPPEKLDEAAATVQRFVRDARRRGADPVEVLITSPGRQAVNGEQLLARLSASAGAPVRVLSSEEEGKLAFQGAIASSRRGQRGPIAVCDVGGGSLQVSVGTRDDGASWVRSVDMGSMRLTSRLLDDDPPGDAAVGRARDEMDGLLDGFLPPLPETALAVGGSARALRAIVGATLGADELHEAMGILARTPAREIASLYTVHLERVRTLAAGAVILGALQERLCVPLRVVRGAGVREGAAIALASRRAAA
jgi:exopolyphosphatase / guanosine-5'-triphosphate,3'-diphosphate pyrophosphatase